MRIFFDAKVVERGPQLPIQPVSFGFVTEDGQERYVINEECLTNVLRDPWSSVNVRPSLPIFDDQHTAGGFITSWDSKHEEYEHVLSLEHLTTVVREFLLAIDQQESGIELWSHFGSFGHVALCQLFGARKDIPIGVPLSYHELDHLLQDNPELAVEIPTPEHINHALWDARWCRDAHTVLSGAQLPETGIKRLTM